MHTYIYNHDSWLVRLKKPQETSNFDKHKLLVEEGGLSIIQY